MEAVSQAFDSFDHRDSFVSFERLTGGLINETYKIYGNQKSYVLQKINTTVFQNPELMLQNKFRVLSYLGSNYPIQFFKTNSGAPYLSIDEEVWILQTFVKNSETFVIGNEHLASEAGKGLALFHKNLMGLDPQNFEAIIPEFHSIELRWEQLEAAFRHSKVNDVPYYDAAKTLYEELWAIKGEIFAFNRSAVAHKSSHSQPENSGLGRYMTHNDPKLSNMLFVENQFYCMIDLDTLMPGYWAWDIGDTLRSICAYQNEDSTAWDKLGFNDELALTFFKSYLKIMGALMTKKEQETLLDGVSHIIGIMSIRFLSDALLGNKYWRADYPEQTLNRAKNQYLLLKDFITKKNSLQSSLNQVISN